MAAASLLWLPVNVRCPCHMPGSSPVRQLTNSAASTLPARRNTASRAHRDARRSGNPGDFREGRASDGQALADCFQWAGGRLVDARVPVGSTGSVEGAPGFLGVDGWVVAASVLQEGGNGGCDGGDKDDEEDDSENFHAFSLLLPAAKKQWQKCPI